jgi:hypothetical protein
MNKRLTELFHLLHPNAWKALRMVKEKGYAGSPEMRQALMQRRLIEWVPGESGQRLTKDGEWLLAEREKSR